MGGSSSVQAAQIDQLGETARDFKDMYSKFMNDRNESFPSLKKIREDKFFSENLPQALEAAEKSVPAGPGPWLVGDQVSYADILFYMFLGAPKGFFENEEAAKAAYQNCPRIKASIEATNDIPELKTWIQNRKDTWI